MVRYYGRYSSRTRGAEHERPDTDEPDAEAHGQARQAAKAAWAKLIRKVYEVDPLLCPECGAQMRVIALIEDPAVIERILSWLGLWEPPQPSGPSPPAERPSPPLTARHRLSAPQAALAVLALPEFARTRQRGAVSAIRLLVRHPCSPKHERL